jgi:DNA-binding NarL/FixJ family response regulator
VTLAQARETVLSSGLRVETGPDPQSRKRTSIVLIDPQTLIRDCISRSFQERLPDLRVVGLTNLAGLLDASRSLSRMDLIVFNVGGASVRDPEVLSQIRWLRQHMLRTPLVLLVDHDDVDDIVAAMEQGVRGFITTSMKLAEVGAAIQCIVAGGTFVPVDVLIRFAQDRQKRSKCGPREDSKELFASLTPRELEVLALLREGKPNKVIARELDIKESTVKVFVGRIFSKLRVSNRKQLAVLARSPAERHSKGSDQR